MEAVRIRLKQRTANYRREETIDNKMTYPLPPFSTVIGAIHNMCGYREYHAMDVSIQGKYGGLKKKVYTDHCFLNSLQNDRGILVKMVNPDLLSSAYVEVAEAKKSQGNDFYKGITIDVKNEEYLKEYRTLKDRKEAISTFQKERIKGSFQPKLKQLKASLKQRKEVYKEDKERLERIKKREKELAELDKQVKQKLKEYEEQNYKIPYSRFRTLTKGPKYYEILTDVELILHIHSSHQVLSDILENIYNLKSIGRSEDTVQVMDAQMVELQEVEESVQSRYYAYVAARAVNKEWIAAEESDGIRAQGTRYFLNKDYTIVDGKRQFHKKAVVYTSGHYAEPNEEMEGVYVDGTEEEDGEIYLVNLI